MVSHLTWERVQKRVSVVGWIGAKCRWEMLLQRLDQPLMIKGNEILAHPIRCVCEEERERREKTLPVLVPMAFPPVSERDPNIPWEVAPLLGIRIVHPSLFLVLGHMRRMWKLSRANHRPSPCG